MGWVLLAAAILLEVAGTTSMKLAEGFTRPLPSALIFVFYGASFVLLTLALRHIEVGIAYAVWAGAGTVLIALIGVAAFGEAMTSLKLLGIALVVGGVATLHAAQG